MTETRRQSTIEELLDRAVRAINDGDRATADELAGQVLAVDQSNPDAEELLSAPVDSGEIRRLTILFADLVDSTALSTRIEPETYRTVVGRYRDEVVRTVERYEGHVGTTKGDGLLAFFGHPKPHEDDVRRAVQTGIDVTRQVATLSERVRRRFGFDIDVRVGIHRGLVYLDTIQDDVYGFGANLAARMSSLADPGTVAVSEAVERLVRDLFQLEPRPAKPVKGVDGLVAHYRAVTEIDTAAIPIGPLIGRSQEREYLQIAWAKAVVGTLSTPGVIFQGEGGIGKSRLAGAAIDLAKHADATILELIGSPFHTEVGLHPVRKLLERRCGIDRTSDPHERLDRLVAEINRLGMDASSSIPLLAPVLGIAPEVGYHPARADGLKLYEQIAGAVRDYLLACAGTGPTLVLVEDMHWLDPHTTGVVHSLLHEDIGGLFVVMTRRNDAPVPGSARVFSLHPFTDDEADDLIVALDPEMEPNSRAAVRRRCDGMPLYIEEVVAKLREQPSDASDSAPVPDTLYEALVARLRSAPDAQRLIETAATIGSQFDRSLLGSVAKIGDQDLDRAIEELRNGRVLEPTGGNGWRFRHELLREVAAELPPPSSRRRLHGRIADALLSQAAEGDPDWPMIAVHYDRAERFDDAASAYQKASSHARQRGALGESRAYLTRALENIARMTPSRARDQREITVRLHRGFLASVARGHASSEAAADFEQCLQLIGADLSSQLYATLTALWSYYTARGDLARATQLTESFAVGLRERRGNRRLNDAVSGMLSWLKGEFNYARTKLETSAADDDLSPARIERAWFAPNDPYASIYTYVALSRFVQGDLAAAEASMARTEHRCREVGFPLGAFSLCYVRSLETWIRIEAGQLELAAQRAKDLARLAQQYGFDEWTMVAATQRATVRALTALGAGQTDGDALQSHIEIMTAFVDAWRAMDLKIYLVCYDAVLARLLAAAGQSDAARARLDTALQLADETLMHFYDAELLRVRATMSDDPQIRQADLCAAVRTAREQGAAVFELRCAADQFELVGEPARAALADVVGRFPAEQTWPDLERARALLK